jgi:wyosine [tRNA(Phe)-imidazoG37] synthetase (radical SAM superfamily)
MSSALPLISAPTAYHLDSSLVSDPHFSKAFNWTINLNLLGPAGKVCSYNCVYCQFGPTEMRLNQIKDVDSFPKPEEFVSDLTTKFENRFNSKEDLATICITGTGEPTLNPLFPEIVKSLVALRDHLSPKTKIALITNGMHFGRRKNKEAALLLDEVVVKLDAGNDDFLKIINAPLVRTNTMDFSTYSRDFDNISIIAQFITSPVNNTTEEHFEDWLEIVGMMSPQRILITAPTHSEFNSHVVGAREEQLFYIAQRLQRKSKYEVLVIV